MWAGGDAVFVLALVLTVAAWLRYEEEENVREDRRLARARATTLAAQATAGTVTAAAAAHEVPPASPPD